MSSPGRVIVEADGGARGNPGPAAYGSLLRDAGTGRVIAERAEAIGTATNNVAEYRGLLAGLELAREYAPDAAVEVRMDSKLVIEQMAGRWKIKHPDMRAIAIAASRVLPADVTWTWVPRERNSAADTLVNAALDEVMGKRTRASARRVEPDVDDPRRYRNPMVGWRQEESGPPTTLVLLRHGVTDRTVARLFCGSGGSDPGLNDLGREQAARAGAWLRRRGGIDVVVSSPLRRTRETAAIVTEGLALPVTLDDGLAEAAFGEWDGLTFDQVRDRYPADLETWLSSPQAAPTGGESYPSVHRRVQAVKARLMLAHPGRTILAVSHVTPIKMLTRDGLDAPMHVIHRLQIAPASFTTISWWADGISALQQLSYVPESNPGPGPQRPPEPGSAVT
ncbi:MAG: bifunctional RNase H/acid phosphatase [Actinomycetota bacterium]|nr:bifunctional RNase H/acid phosphatase [Actinomycetota bacterium]